MKTEKNKALKNTINILDTVYDNDVQFADLRTKAYNICRPYRETSDKLTELVEFIRETFAAPYKNGLEHAKLVALAASLHLDIQANLEMWKSQEYGGYTYEELDKMARKLKTVVVFS